MSSHTCTPRTDYSKQPILSDECGRCEEHAKASMLLSLDRSKVAALYNRMVMVEREGEGIYLSDAEASACRTLYHFAVFVERYLGMDPWSDEFIERFDA